MSDPHPLLVPLLEGEGLTLETFLKLGRPPAGVREARERIITSLHEKGTSWAEMMSITGLSNGAIQRLTKAMHNPASKENQREVGRCLGRTWKGKSRHEQLKRQWAAGTFEFFRGRIRSEEERAKLKAGWTPEIRVRHGDAIKQVVWGNPDTAGRLLAFHRDPEQRVLRSQAQEERMRAPGVREKFSLRMTEMIKNDPAKFLRGKGQLLATPKGDRTQVWVRSSYEARAVKVLEEDTSVKDYVFEPVFHIAEGKRILPDFLVTYADGRKVLIEVKASWVLKMPSDHKVSRRLALARNLALQNSWGYVLWTEKELWRVDQRAA